MLTGDSGARTAIKLPLIVSSVMSAYALPPQTDGTCLDGMVGTGFDVLPDIAAVRQRRITFVDGIREDICWFSAPTPSHRQTGRRRRCRSSGAEGVNSPPGYAQTPADAMITGVLMIWSPVEAGLDRSWKYCRLAIDKVGLARIYN